MDAIETVTVDGTKYAVTRRDNSLSAIGRNKNLSENQQLVWMVKPNGKHGYMTIETTENGIAVFGKVNKVF